MDRHTTMVAERIDRCADVVSLRLERPEGYTFRAGQYLALSLKTVSGIQRKPFTHSSAPADPYLEITTRLSASDFKNALAELDAGDEVTFSGPAGRFRVPDGEEQVAFLAGGVGITPVISTLRAWDSEGGAPRRTVLFYGNRDMECIPFGDEISRLGTGVLEMVHVLEQPPEGWPGASGFIGPDLVSRQLGSLDRWLFVVTGPPVMVEAMERVLDALGVDDERRLIERFGTARTG